jgi:hypothetical protein
MGPYEQFLTIHDQEAPGVLICLGRSPVNISIPRQLPQGEAKT